MGSEFSGLGRTVYYIVFQAISKTIVSQLNVALFKQFSSYLKFIFRLSGPSIIQTVS